MKKEAKKLISLTLSLMLVLSALCVVNVSAQADNTVTVTVENKTFDGAPWTGELFTAEVELQDTDSIESVLERAITERNYAFSVTAYGYIASVNGLEEYAVNGSGGWMASINNWFTADGTGAYTVANGGLKAGDEIVLQYTCTWGADVGSLYGDYNTALSTDFSVEGSNIAGYSFNAASTADEGALYITAPDVLTIRASAVNKNYQTRFYLNGYNPSADGFRCGKNIPVKDGDTVYIGVGDPSWPSMNSWGGIAEKSVYCFKVQQIMMGDIDGNGKVDVNDVTELQRYLAEFITLDDAQLAAADADKDGLVTIKDATFIQRIVAEFDL